MLRNWLVAIRHPLRAIRRSLSSVATRSSAFAGAAINRLTSDWIFSPLRSADAELKGDITKLRVRARDLGRNDEHATRYLGLLEENVVGPRGIMLQARVVNANGNPDDKTNRAIERAWKEWSRPEIASVDGRLSWRDILVLCVQTLAQDGEYLIRLVPGFQNPFLFAIQVLDVDQLDVTLNRPKTAGVNEVRMGVEINKWGRPVAYHIWDRHPNDSMGARDRSRQRFPAAQIIHDYVVKRPGQTRGVTWFAPTMVAIKMLAGYREAELVAARTAAAKMGFFQREAEAEPDPNQFGPAEEEPVTIEAAPGILEELPPGVTFESWNPEHPTTAFSEFVRSTVRSIATGLRVSYNTLAGDLERVSFSSLRSGALAERDVWRGMQVRLAEHLCDRVYRTWLTMAIPAGAIEGVAEFNQGLFRVEWQPRGWKWVDPMKEVQAAGKAIGLGLDSRTRIAAEQGHEIEDIFEDLAREQILAEALAVSIDPDAAKANPAPVRSMPNGNGHGVTKLHPVIQRAMTDA